jgi:hypothetical protein
MTELDDLVWVVEEEEEWEWEEVEWVWAMVWEEEAEMLKVRLITLSND